MITPRKVWRALGLSRAQVRYGNVTEWEMTGVGLFVAIVLTTVAFLGCVGGGAIASDRYSCEQTEIQTGYDTTYRLPQAQCYIDLGHGWVPIEQWRPVTQ